MSIKSSFWLIVIGVTTLFGCNRDKNVNPDPIPEIPVNTTINLALHAPFLDIPGSFFYEQGGFKGLAVIHDFDGTFRVFDRTCSYQPQSTCNLLHVDTLTLQFKCGDYDSSGFVQCCASRFDFSGFAQRQPAVFPIKQYRTSRAGNLLNVVN
jgi:hypothetical protein